MANTWQPLVKGDTIDIIAPASGSTKSEFKGAIQFIKKFGLVPRVPKDLYGKDILCSNTDAKRFAHLKKALLAKDTKAIWCMRGGYGSQRLIPDLAKVRKPARTKLFIGYSDITALHNFLNQKWNWPTLHGTMLTELGRGEGGRRELMDFHKIIYGKTDAVEFNTLKPMNAAAKKTGTIRASIVGGNLAMLESTLGTAVSFSAKGKILVLEDIGERGYRVDRMLVHMEQAGALKGVRAVVFGDFVGGEENREDDDVYLWKDVQNQFAKLSKVPVFKGLPFGHGPFQRPVPFNTKAVLKLGKMGQLKVAVK